MAITRITTANAIADSSVQNIKMSNIVQSKNIIINGDMSLAQRATSVTGITGGSYHTVDRFGLNLDLGTWTQSQSTDVPTGQGFAKSLKMDCTTANASPSSGILAEVRQKIEGQNLQYIKKGTSDAESLTVSFWVKSNKTGTYICELLDNDNSRQISKSYTISSANTWEKKTLTYAGDTSGAFGNDNGASLELHFWLGAGSNYTSGTLSTTWTSITSANRAVGQVNLADSTSNDWYVTGIQLEAGTTASEFEFLPFDVNFERCKRYFTIPVRSRGSDTPIANGTMYSASDFYGVFEVGKGMRATPTLAFPTGTNFYGLVGNGNASTFTGSTMSFGNIANDGTCKARIAVTSVSNKVQGQGAWVRFEAATDTDDFISASAEL